MSNKTSNPNFNEPRRIALLLADRAVHALPDEEDSELAALLARHPATDDTEIDEAAAALHLAKPILPESMPSRLRARLFVYAENFVFEKEKASEPMSASSEKTAALRGAAAEPHIQPAPTPIARAAISTDAANSSPNNLGGTNIPAETAEVLAFPSASSPLGKLGQPRRTASQTISSEAKPKPRVDIFGRIGWLAAAACFAIAFAGVREARQLQKQVVALQAEKTPPDYLALRKAMLAQGSIVKPLDWTPTAYPGMQTVSGDVVWSDAKQEGYMRFVGLPANDPREQVYQLWIFAANQEEAHPVDGGVFNVNAHGEVIIPITAKLFVERPSLFAITIEKPGGVVVSKRDKLALIAKAI